ncbi:MAG: restriction endonuclease [Paludibacter sp.]|nr:restriction endonuclease [Paludibacter sp.]
MNWKDYEKEIHNYFKEMFPNADISHNVTVLGRYSKVERQIDILIEDYIAGCRMRIVIDGKLFSEKIDVKDVEMFIGMLNDCEANKGLLITQEGFSKAAINRAYHDPIDIELDILNFKDLYQFQGSGGIPYSGKHGVLLPAPFGWIIDATRRNGMLATLYQRGLTLEKAGANKEWMYVNLRSKDDEIKTIDDFLKFQEKNTLREFPKAKISFLPTVKRDDATIKLRVIDISTYPTKEYTGFVDFKDFIFFCVMFTPDELNRKNIRKLESILQRALPININQPAGL